MNFWKVNLVFEILILKIFFSAQLAALNDANEIYFQCIERQNTRENF